MSKSKPTPGEWTIGDVSKTLADTADGKRKGRLAASIHHPGNLSWPLMRVGASSDDDLDEVMANARLVVAAKDTLAGAKLALDLAEGLIKSDYENTSAYHPMMGELEPVRAAIAKAEGRS